jgi:hypothetical protein
MHQRDDAHDRLLAQITGQMQVPQVGPPGVWTPDEYAGGGVHRRARAWDRAE